MAEPTVVLYVRIPVDVKAFLDSLTGGRRDSGKSIQSEVTRIIREAMLARPKVPAMPAFLDSKHSPASASKTASSKKPLDELVDAFQPGTSPVGNNRRRADRRGRGARLADPNTWSRKLHAEIDEALGDKALAPKYNPEKILAAGMEDQLKQTTRGTLLSIRWPGTADGKNMKFAKFVKLSKTGSGLLVNIECVDSKGRPNGKYGDDRSIKIGDVLAVGPFVRRLCGANDPHHKGISCNLTKDHPARHHGENEQGSSDWSATGGSWSPKPAARPAARAGKSSYGDRIVVW